MAEESWGHVWWSVITGPRTFIERVTQALCDGRSAVLLLPDTCPWRAEMRSFSAEAVTARYGLERLSVDPVRVEPTAPGAAAQTPFQFLLERYALRDAELRYRESMDPQEFLVEQQVLRNRIVWLEGAGEKELRAWLAFLSAWRAPSQTDGLFVCEVPARAVQALVGVARDNVELIDYEEFVSDYSVSLFNGMLVDERAARETSNLKQRYLESLLTSLCGRDVEVSEALADDLSALRDDPIAATMSTARYFEPERGAGDEAHVLSLVRANDRETLERRVWAAQVEVLFPLIETMRLDVIEALRPELEELVNLGRVYQYDERVEHVEDVELGTLIYLMARREENDERTLRVPDRTLREKIHLLRACRNDLAHISACPPEQVRDLLAYATGRAQSPQ